MAQEIRCYLDISTLLASAPGLSVIPFVGGNSILASDTLIGATSLPLVSATGFQGGQLVYILDGPNTELVQAATTPSSDNTLLLTSGTTYAHAGGVSVSSGGVQGAIADKLIAASAWVEGFCDIGVPGDRGFFSKARSERQALQTMRAALNREYMLMVHPLSFPVTAVSSAVLEAWPGQSILNFDATKVFIDPSGLSFTAPYLASTTVMPQTPWVAGPSLRRSSASWAYYTYTAGFPYLAGTPNGGLPWDFVEACRLVARHLLAQSRNPTGAAILRQEQVEIVQRLRGNDQESSADSELIIRAKEMLVPYQAKAM